MLDHRLALTSPRVTTDQSMQITGLFCLSLALASTCPSGFYKTAENVCLICPGGLFSNHTDSVHCSTCPPSTYSSPGSSSCQPCPLGYESESGSVSCQPVEQLGSPDPTPAPAPSPCSCPANHRCAPDCVPCPSGQVSPPDSRTCHICPENTVLENGDCQPCPPNSSTPAGSSRCQCLANFMYEDGDCVLCPAGFYSEANSTACKSCLKGFYCPGNGTSYVCPAGSYCPVGSNQSVLCGTWEYSPPKSGDCYRTKPAGVTIAALGVAGLTWFLIPFHGWRLYILRKSSENRFLKLFHLLSALSLLCFATSMLWSESCLLFIKKAYGKSDFCLSFPIHVLAGAYGGEGFSVLGYLSFILQIWFQMVLVYYAGMEVSFAQGPGLLWKKKRSRWKWGIICAQVITLSCLVGSFHPSESFTLPIFVYSMVSLGLTMVVSALSLVLVLRLACTINFTYRCLPFLSTKALAILASLQWLALLLYSISSSMNMYIVYRKRTQSYYNSRNDQLPLATTSLFLVASLFLSFASYGFAWILPRKLSADSGDDNLRPLVETPAGK